MPSLINLESQRDRLVEEIMELTESTSNEGIPDATDPEELVAKFEELEAAITDKVDAIAAVVAAQKGDIAYLKSRRDEFTRIIDRKVKALEKFENYLKAIVTNRPDAQLKGLDATIKVVKNGGVQPIWLNPDIEERNFPPDLVTIATTYKVDRQAVVKKLAESGQDSLIVDGKPIATVQPRGTHLRIG
ncbi:siphovirus Gp157 family protein [Chamaesiphon minutus]|uniref:Siphovirus Gp157 protein n=1 Tax=Chamaesiphon minutus (strain ATCC 27169 / PCC 6605) TaxID=1173020 RepID=K9UF84_CHAP6|nr:siphovirus Gp157 family protein [Chamaesiphon minutus]AFY92864.1 siphovirus Gp157 protein [Chamaesiphon minutus PCC 6605]